MGRLFVIPALILIALLLGSGLAAAQSVSPDEAVTPRGSVGQDLMLTPAQRSAIYNAVFRQRMKPSAVLLSTAVGAPVPQTVELIDIPDAATGDNPAAAHLKYATVDGDIVLVDPLRMRVVDVIHDGIKP